MVSVRKRALRQIAERLFWPALALYVFILPVQHTVALRYVALAVLLVATTMLLVASAQRPVLPLAWPWLAYAGAALSSVPFALAPDYSLSEIRVEVFYCMVIFVVAATAASNLGGNPIRGIAMIAVAANVIYVTAAFAFLDPSDGMAALYRMPPVAFAGVNSNLLVTVMPLAAYATLGLWRQRKHWSATIVASVLVLDLAALIMSYNRQGLIALGAGILCAGILVLRRRFTWTRFAVLAGALVLVASLLVLQFTRRGFLDPATFMPPIALSATNGLIPPPPVEVAPAHNALDTALARDGRWGLWTLAVQGIADRPWTGSGFGRNTFSLLYPEVKAADKNHWHAHNMVLNKGVQMGIPGMLAFLLLWAALAREFLTHSGGGAPRFALSVAALATVAAVFMKNMTDDFFVRDMALTFWVLMGFYVGALRTLARAEREPV